MNIPPMAMSDDLSKYIVTVVVVGAMQIYREARNRRWQREELQAREEAAKVRTGQVLTSIAENTEISKTAFEEANGTNKKLLEIHDRIERHRQAQRDQEEIFRQELAKLDALLPEKKAESN